MQINTFDVHENSTDSETTNCMLSETTAGDTSWGAPLSVAEGSGGSDPLTSQAHTVH